MSDTIRFEFDLTKSAINNAKHGVRLEEAQQLWKEASVIVEARSKDEPRFMVIGKIGERFFTCIFTERQGVIRLISLRRSRDDEKKIYDETNKKENDSS